MVRRRKVSERGQSLVEFCLMMPMFLILVFGIIDFGMGLRAYITVAQATREGARYASIGSAAGTSWSSGPGQCSGSATTTVVGRVCSTMNGLDLTKLSGVSVTYPNGNTPGQSVHVSASYSYYYITPLSRLVSFFSGGSLGTSIPVNSSTDMRLE